jgi:hypothetical protein
MYPPVRRGAKGDFGPVIVPVGLFHHRQEKGLMHEVQAQAFP